LEQSLISFIYRLVILSGAKPAKACQTRKMRFGYSTRDERLSQKPEHCFIHAIILSDAPAPFAQSLHNRLIPFCYPLPLVILPELPVLWCITITTCTSRPAGKNRLHRRIVFSHYQPFTAHSCWHEVVVKIIYDGILAEFGAVKLQTLQEIKIISRFAPQRLACSSSRMAKNYPSRIICLSAEALKSFIRSAPAAGLSASPALPLNRQPRGANHGSADFSVSISTRLRCLSPTSSSPFPKCTRMTRTN
jgi:hypothetical protein